MSWKVTYIYKKTEKLYTENKFGGRLKYWVLEERVPSPSTVKFYISGFSFSEIEGQRHRRILGFYLFIVNRLYLSDQWNRLAGVV